MLLFNRIVPNRHIVRQIYRLIFKPKFWRREVSPELLRILDDLIANKHRVRAQGTGEHADPP